MVDEEQDLDEIKVDKAEKEEKKGKGSALKVIGVLLLIVIIGILVFIKFSNPNFAIGTLIIWGIVGAVVSLAIVFSFEIYTFFKQRGKLDESGKLPKPITPEEAYIIVEKMAMNPKYGTYIGEISYDGTEDHGQNQKQTIYCIDFKGWNDNIRYFGAVNLHYPIMKKKFIKDTKEKPITDVTIAQIKKRLVSDPEESPDVIKSHIENPFTGVKQTMIRRIHSRDKVKQDKEKGALE